MVDIILFYCDRMQGFFGLGSHVKELIGFLKKQPNMNITLVLTETTKYKECTLEYDDGLNILYIPTPENGLFLTSENTVISRTLALRILQIAYPYLINLKNPVCWFNSIAELNLVREIKNFIKCKILYVHHGWAWKDHIKVEDEVFEREWRQQNSGFCRPAFDETIQQLEMVENADITVTVTRQASDYFLNAFDVSKWKVKTIYNGITAPNVQTFNREEVRRQLGIRKGEKIILFSGRLVASKGIFYLIDAFRSLLLKIPNCRLVLLGTGSLGETLRAAMPIWSKVTLTEFVSQEWIQKWYLISDVGILPSLMEQCSYAAIEMLFWRLPLIVSAVDGLDELFEHNVDCLKIPIHHGIHGQRVLDPVEIEQLLFSLLTNKTIGKRLSSNGYKKGMRLFTAERMGKEYYRLLETMGSTVHSAEESGVDRR